IKNVLRVATQIPPFDVPIFALLFQHSASDHDRMRVTISYSATVSVDNFLKYEVERNQGVVGTAWAKGVIWEDKRNSLNKDQLISQRNMTSLQAEIAGDLKSLVGIPVWLRNEIIGIMVIASNESMQMSRLNEYKEFLNLLAGLIRRLLTEDNKIH
ncbi:MAG: GAF domain-containing protein, partial [Chloroflexota bacterium]